MPNPDEQPLDLTIRDNQCCGNCRSLQRSDLFFAFLCEDYMEPGLQTRTYLNRAGANFRPCIITHPENWCSNWEKE